MDKNKKLKDIIFLNKKETYLKAVVWAANPPGHGGSNLEPLHDIRSLIGLYYEELQEIIKPQSVFFGHSMGGIVAYFLLQRMLDSTKHNIEGITLVLSACNTPKEFKTTNYSNLSDDKLIDHLLTYDGIPDELIHERNLLNFFLPVFRADFKILESSPMHDFTPLELPVYFLWGENDRIVPMESGYSMVNIF
ncbi:alpha/beta fold hydrolase [Virgibacillus sp. C22-A2]|uniref:Alpha/beta fold hydrolase n=1 Tax=Virgibacillus tibetensis TaxID=3042313 RepID=A0ABU6KFG8_9BACI|nr:alpha/beta fold hydrolase [Virgibacillus sp. C22-A2]